MAWNGSGTFALTYTWATEAASPPISISKLDTEFANVKTGLENCLTRDGQNKPSANIDWNAKKITNLATPTADADAVTKAYVDDGATASTFTGTLTGMSSSTTGTVKYRIVGGVVFMWVDTAITGTSNATTMTMTGLPSECQPAAKRFAYCVTTDEGGNRPSVAELAAGSGTVTFSILQDDTGSGGFSLGLASSGFGSSLTKGLGTGWLISYPLT